MFQILSEFNKKDYGVVLTPQKTAKYIILRLGEIKKEHKILDPCVGHLLYNDYETFLAL